VIVRRSLLVRAWLTAILVVIDLALTAMMAMVWNAQRLGQVSGRDVATLSLLGVSAAAGVMIFLVVVAANVSAARAAGAGRGLATAGSWLAGLRLAGVFVATVVIAVTLGPSAVVGPAESFAVALAVLDALGAVFVAGVTLRGVRARHI
jgi:sugar phosphate permease